MVEKEFKKAKQEQTTRYQIPVIQVAHLENRRSSNKQIQAMLDFEKKKDKNPFQMLGHTFVECLITTKFCLTNTHDMQCLFVICLNWNVLLF